jgi:hypothetical protein
MHTPAGTLLLRSLMVAVLVLGAAGCSDAPAKPGTIKSSTPSVEASSPTPTAMPAEQQVEAAVRAYYAELTHAAQTNDTSDLKRMLAENCPCFRAVRVIEAGVGRGEITPDAAWALDAVRVHDVTGSAAVAEVRYRVNAYDVLGRDGTVIDHVARRVNHFDISLVESQGHWIVANVFDLEG